MLDWRHRAQEFGLNVDGRDGTDPSRPYDEPGRLLQDDEPEAFADQPIPDGGIDDELEDENDEQAEQAPQAGVSREDVDLVRVYLQHIGKRRC